MTIRSGDLAKDVTHTVDTDDKRRKQIEDQDCELRAQAVS